MSALQELRKTGRSVELLRGNDVLITPPPPKKWIDRLRQAKAEIVADLKAEQTKDSVELTQQEAEALGVRTVWKWRLDNGDGGTLFSDYLTYEEARKGLEKRFHAKVRQLEFISSVAEGRGFTEYRPALLH